MDEQLMQFIQQYPVEVLKLIEMLSSMNEQELKQFVAALQQLIQQGQGQGGGGAQPTSAEMEQEMANQNLLG